MKQLFTAGMLALSLGLLALGIGALVAPAASAEGYGVPTDAATWVRATGARDLVLGLMTLAIWRTQPAALRVFVPIMLLLPLADVILVLVNGEPLLATVPHVVGAVGIFVLAILTWRVVPG